MREGGSGEREEVMSEERERSEGREGARRGRDTIRKGNPIFSSYGINFPLKSSLTVKKLS